MHRRSLSRPVPPLLLHLALTLATAALARAQGVMSPPRAMLPVGRTMSGELTQASPVLASGMRATIWVFEGSAGDRVRIDMRSAQFDSFLILRDAEGQEIAQDDDSGGGLNSSMEVVLPRTGVYEVVAASLGPSERSLGTYTLTVTEEGTAVAAMAMPPHCTDTTPQFPWPPPWATARVPIPRGLVTRPASSRAADTLGYVADSIESALRRAGIEWAVYAIGDSGFAYVTRIEMIQPTGEPIPPPDRFPEDIATATGSSGFLGLVVSRFRARQGHFRIIAVVVTSRPVTAGPSPMTVDEAICLIHGGMPTLPATLRRRAVRDLDVVALVYEFERLSAADSVTLRSAPMVSASRHLVAAGLWTSRQLGAAP